MRRNLKSGQAVEVQQLIDEFGFLSEQEKELKRRKEDLRKRLINLLGEGTHTGRNFSVEIVKRKDPVISVVKAFKLLGLKKFLQVVSVSVTALRKFLTEDEVASVVEDYKETFVVSSKKRG